MAGNVKKQHYVPRMYLKRFSGDNNRLCVWNLSNDSIMTRQRPENFAANRYYYDTNKNELKKALSELIKIYPKAESIVDFNDEQFVEKALSRMEADVSKVLDEVTSDYEAFYDETNMRKIIIFLHDLSVRSEKYRMQLENVREQELSHLEKMGIDPSRVEGMDNASKDSQLYGLLAFSPLIRTTMQLIDNYDWYIGVACGKMKFIISDDPAQGVRLGFNDICIPLNGDVAMVFKVNKPNAPLISKEKPTGHTIQLSDKSVISYNAIQLSYANRYIFGDKETLTLLQRFINRQGGYKNIFGDAPMKIYPFD